MADKAIENSTGPSTMLWRTQKFHMLLSVKRIDSAAELLTDLTKECDESSPVPMDFSVYQHAENFDDVSPELLSAAIAAAETAVKQSQITSTPPWCWLV